jgi:putative FmdB family regulatory protein
MPTYEYQCEKCAHKFEAFQQISQEPLRSCPVCRGPLKRLISAGAGFIFKGPGFYATDYRSREYKDKQKQEAKADTTASSASKNNEGCKKCPVKNKVESRE